RERLPTIQYVSRYKVIWTNIWATAEQRRGLSIGLHGPPWQADRQQIYWVVESAWYPIQMCMDKLCFANRAPAPRNPTGNPCRQKLGPLPSRLLRYSLF